MLNWQEFLRQGMRPVLRDSFLTEEHNELLQMSSASADTRNRYLPITTYLRLEKCVMTMANRISTDASNSFSVTDILIECPEGIYRLPALFPVVYPRCCL